MRCLTVLTLACALTGTAAHAQSVVAVPSATSLPVTATSRSFLASASAMVPMPLVPRGYVEEEFLVSGTANVYDWPGASLRFCAPERLYTTRILVRRPQNAARFSGAVIIEPMFAARRWDWPMMWGYMREEIVARGDAWVGITFPGSVPGLQRFDAQRYASLSFANPTPQQPCPGQTATSTTEEGLRWDVLSQVAALIKSSRDVMGQLHVEAAYLTVQAGDLTTYMAAIHPHALLANGRTAYNGYIARPPLGLARINRCAAAPARDDPRQIIRNVGVPVIAVVAEGDLAAGAVSGFAARRNDSDDWNDRFRWIEVPGAGHIDRDAYTGFPSLADQDAAGNALGTVEWPFAAPCTPAIPLAEPPMLRVGYNVALNALDNWVRRGIKPPHIPRIETRGTGTSLAVVADEHGNARGGLRSPYVDVPVASYTTTSPGPANCPEMGHTTRFDAQKLTSVYGSFGGYAAKASASIATLRRAEWLTPRDAQRLSRELIEGERAKWPRQSSANSTR